MVNATVFCYNKKMEMNAYYDGYVTDAQETLGNMMYYAVNSCGMEPEDIFVMFLSSGVAEQFEKGNPRYVTGMSGAELAKEIVLKMSGQELKEPEEYYIDKTAEYWCGGSWLTANGALAEVLKKYTRYSPLPKLSICIPHIMKPTWKDL